MVLMVARYQSMGWLAVLALSYVAQPVWGAWSGGSEALDVEGISKTIHKGITAAVGQSAIAEKTTMKNMTKMLEAPMFNPTAERIIDARDLLMMTWFLQVFLSLFFISVIFFCLTVLYYKRGSKGSVLVHNMTIIIELVALLTVNLRVVFYAGPQEILLIGGLLGIFSAVSLAVFDILIFKTSRSDTKRFVKKIGGVVYVFEKDKNGAYVAIGREGNSPDVSTSPNLPTTPVSPNNPIISKDISKPNYQTAKTQTAADGRY